MTTRPAPPILVQLALVPLLYWAGAKLSTLFAVMPEVLVMLWLSNGLLLVTLLHYGLRRYAYFALAIILAEVVADYPTFSVVEAVLFGAINLVEVTIAWSLLRRWRFDWRFASPGDTAKFFIAGPVIGAFVAACCAGAVYTYFRGAETTYLESVRVWWFSDATGLLITTPLALTLWPVAPGGPREELALRWYDGVAAVLGMAAVGMLLAAQQGALRGMYMRPSILLPFAIYAAARLTPRGAMMAVGALAATVLWVTRNGQQPFGALSPQDTILQAQQFVMVLTITSLGLAALLSQVRGKTRELELRVRERTAELSAANEQLRKLAITDPLTGALNRRALFDFLHREMERSARHGHELAVILFDVDHFKEVNDRNGHAAGDAVLRHVAQLTAGMVRSADALARYGGEEFALVAPETDELRARQLAERIREALAASDLVVKDRPLRVTASFGVAMLRPTDNEPDEVLARADAALYAAKNEGRNRVVVHVEPSTRLAAS